MPGGEVMRSIASMGQRWPQQGKIKFGERTEKAMRTLKTWRFMSPDRDAIERLAAEYGGTVRPLSDPTANPTEQWQVTTTSNIVRVYLPRGGYTLWYELWTKGRRLRQCDGTNCDALEQTPEGSEVTTQPCLCNERGIAQCKPKLRLDVMLPILPFAGCWRFETGSWNASEEIPKMVALIEQLQTMGIAEAELVLTPQTKMREVRDDKTGKMKLVKTHYIVPSLRVPHSIDAIVAGAASVGAIGPAVTQVALPRGEPVYENPYANDGEVIDAEIVDDEPEAHDQPPISEEDMLINVADVVAFGMGLPLDGLSFLLAIASSLGDKPVSTLAEIDGPTWARTREALRAAQEGTARIEVSPAGVKVWRVRKEP